MANREEGEYKIILFQIASFYVEVFFNVKRKKFERLKGFKSTHQLHCYLQQIDISEVLAC